METLDIITHFVLQRSSRWVLGKTLTKKDNIKHMEHNRMVFQVLNGLESMLLADINHLSYVFMSYFSKQTNGMTVNCMNLHSNIFSWANTRNIIDKVHKHVCGNTEYSGFKILLERNNFWSDQGTEYVSEIIKMCNACRSTPYPKPNRKVSISSLSNNFNQI